MNHVLRYPKITNQNTCIRAPCHFRGELVKEYNLDSPHELYPYSSHVGCQFHVLNIGIALTLPQSRVT